MFKILACAAILFSSTALGFLKAADFEKRENILKHLKSDLDFIQNEIAFMLTPIDEIIGKLSRKEGELKIFYKSVYEKILQNTDVPFSQIWLGETKKLEKVLPLTKSDTDVLSLLGQSFGKSDVDGQISAIKTAFQSLNIQLDSAVSDKNKNSRLFKSLGFYAGILIIVMFF